MTTRPAWGEQGMAGVSLVADPVLLGQAFHWDLDRGQMLGWILALVGDGLGRMDPSCPAASPGQAPGRLQRAAGAGAPRVVPGDVGTPIAPGPPGPGASGKGRPSTPNCVPVLQLMAVTLWGVWRDWGSQQRGAGATRRASSPIASSLATLPFIPGLSKPSRMPCRAAPCLRPATHGHAAATLRQGIRMSQAD